MKKLFVLTLCLLFNLGPYAAGGGKLLDLLVNESGLIQLLTRNGIEGAAAVQVKTYVKNSILALSKDADAFTPAGLRKIMMNLDSTPTDKKIHASLVKLLNKDADSLSTNEVVEAINNLIFLSNRYGWSDSLVLACSQCVGSALAPYGFKFTLEEVTQSSVRQVLESTLISKDPRKLSSFIADRMKRLKVGKFSNVGDLVKAEEEKSLAIFLALAEKGSPATPAQRDFIDAVFEFSKTPGGDVKLLNPDNPHKFWTLFDNGSNNDSVLAGYAKLLREASEEGKSKVNRKEAFYDVLQRNAGDSPEATKRVNSIRLKNCFFGR